MEDSEQYHQQLINKEDIGGASSTQVDTVILELENLNTTLQTTNILIGLGIAVLIIIVLIRWKKK